MSRRGAAALVLPLLLVAACGGGGSSKPHVVPSPPPSSAGSPSATASPASPAPQGPAGGPVPAGFQPASVSFVSPGTGWALGTTPSCATAPCTSLVRTADGGAHWVGIPAPRAPLTGATATQLSPASGAVSHVRFADPLDGFAFGPALYATHDGGGTWAAVDTGGRTVLALEAAGSGVVLLTAACTEAGCSDGQVQAMPAAGGPTTQLAAAPGSVTGASLAVHAPAAFALFAHGTTATILATSGGAWTALPDPCSGATPTPTALAAPDAVTLYSLCTGGAGAGQSPKTVVATARAATSVQGSPPIPGDPEGITATPDGVLLLSATSGSSWLYRSTDGGRSWTTAKDFADGGMSLTDLGFTTATQGAVVEGVPLQGGTSRLWLTRDAGATWGAVTF
jgi:hypothetical protein